MLQVDMALTGIQLCCKDMQLHQGGGMLIVAVLRSASLIKVVKLKNKP